MHDSAANTPFTAITGTLRKAASGWATAIFMLGTALGGNVACAQLPPAQHNNQIEFISGGIGIDESTAFKQAMPQYPLALTFAEKMGGSAAYVSDVRVVIHNAQGDTLLQADSNGPYFLVKLPPGHYKVSATYKNKTITQAADVHAKGSARAMFEWGQ